MGMMPAPKKCHLTKLPTENFPSSWDLVEYVIQVKDERYLLRFHWNHENSPIVQRNLYILNGLILNKMFPLEFLTKTDSLLDNEKLESIIKEADYPKNPEDKIANLLIYLHSLQNFEGSKIEFPKTLTKDELAASLFFKNYEELSFYLFTLLNKGLVTGIDATSKDGPELISIKLTYEGLSAVIDLNESGNQSDRCFIAMSFSESQLATRNAIKASIHSTDFQAIIIDEQHIDSDVTINDAMIAEIKRSKFVVADFTQHKHGVYFEAGYALGLKKPVIYLCALKDFENTHFDTNHYPHIIYSSLEELQEKLKSKIEAWIK
jgi:nucleoside 2-deoxyribosyltransferase